MLDKKEKKIAKIDLDYIKDHGWYEVGNDLGMSEKKIYEIFEYGEYGSISIIIDEDLNIIGGKVNPCGK